MTMFKTFREKGLIWPIFVIALLVTSVGSMMIVVILARSDGGAQVVDQYYEKALAWDSLSAMNQAYQVRNWISVLSLGETNASMYIQDDQGNRVSSVSGSVRLTQPQSSAEGLEVPLVFITADSTYQFETGTLSTGLWDFGFQMDDGTDQMMFTLRKEVL